MCSYSSSTSSYKHKYIFRNTILTENRLCGQGLRHYSISNCITHQLVSVTPSILDWISSLGYFGFILLSYELTTESYKHHDSIKQPQTVWHTVKAQQSMTNSDQQQSNELTLCSITLAADVLLHLLLLLGMLGTQTAHVLLQSHQHRLFCCQLSLISGHRTTQLLSTFLHRTEHGIFRPRRTYLLQNCTGAATRHTTAVYKF